MIGVATQSDKAGRGKSLLLPLPKVDASSPMPLHLQVRAILSEAIRSGLLIPGDRLPSTPHLAQRLGVCVLTAHRALKGLTEEGWLVRERGRCTRVRTDFRDALARTPRFRIAVAMHADAAHSDHTTLRFLAGLQTTGSQIVPPTEIIIHQYESILQLRHVKANGILCIQPRPDEVPVLEELSDSTSIVLLDCPSSSASLHIINADHAEGARLAVRHLAGLGHRRIALIDTLSHGTSALERLNGFMNEMAAHRLPVSDDCILASLESMGEDQLTQRLADRIHAPQELTALIAGDLGAAMRVRACLNRGRLDSPGEISLVSLGDDWFTKWLTPPMTVVAQPIEEMARRAFSRLLQMLNGRTIEERMERVPPVLVAREQVRTCTS